MRRRQLFEFEDLKWFPAVLRDYLTDYLGFVSVRFKLYASILVLLREALKAGREDTLVDLTSGGGGAMPWIAKELLPEYPNFKIILTDYYPGVRAFERMATDYSDSIRYDSRSIDARAVPADLTGFRTQFLSFHHFGPDEAQRILDNAVAAHAPIGVFEAQRRDISHLFRFAFSPTFVLLLTPHIRPFRWGRVLFTYLLPLVPAAVFWDGIVSVLRTYSVEEMKAAAAAVPDSARYTWKIGEVTENQITILYLIGVPAAED